MTDLQRIKLLEEEIEFELMRIDPNIVMMKKNGYSIDETENVTGLNLDNCNLKRIPESVLQFEHLVNISLYNNEISETGMIFSRLPLLERIHLGKNRLQSIPEVVGEIMRLMELGLSENWLQILPENIGNMVGLKTLYLSNNRLKMLPDSMWKMERLEKLYINDNKFRSLPKSLLDLGLPIQWMLSSKNGIYLSNNPLESPPVEIIKKGNDAIREYFVQLDSEERPLNEVRVLLVGDGGSGKTSCKKSLLKRKFDPNESQTHGINIETWTVYDEYEKVKVNIWDFGGQEIMHATHQFFLAKRSLYILVLDARRDDKTEYWLKHIESFGGDSPILVAINKMDENPAYDVNRQFLMEKYKGIRSFHRISCKDGSGIDELNTAFTEELLKIEMRKIQFGSKWLEVKRRLEEETADYISRKEYKNICVEAGIETETSMETLIDFLHDLGITLHFREFNLEDTHVMNPEWATGAVYRIINSKALAKSQGVLRLERMKTILKSRKKDKYTYPVEKHPYIINLMKKFELCYELNDDQILIPDLTDIQEPLFIFGYETSLRFRIDYDFLPRSILPRFVVNMHQDVHEDILWRTGVMLKNDGFNSKAVVKADYDAKKIFIYVNGSQQRDYSATILDTFRRINDSFEKLEAIEKVCLPDKQHIGVSYAHLIRLEMIGQTMYFPEEADHEYNISELLGSIFGKRMPVNEILDLINRLYNAKDTENTLYGKVWASLKAEPTFFGLGIDLKELVRQFFSRKGR
ncbi:MAG: GTP-binding protein [Calditrichaeota bacterium]|nr:GTP-binding protein [Calditrichota bacterium]